RPEATGSWAGIGPGMRTKHLDLPGLIGYDQSASPCPPSRTGTDLASWEKPHMRKRKKSSRQRRPGLELLEPRYLLSGAAASPAPVDSLRPSPASLASFVSVLSSDN